jgi:hypothetical protein
MRNLVAPGHPLWLTMAHLFEESCTPGTPWDVVVVPMLEGMWLSCRTWCEGTFEMIVTPHLVGLWLSGLMWCYGNKYTFAVRRIGVYLDHVKLVNTYCPAIGVIWCDGACKTADTMLDLECVASLGCNYYH